MSYSDQQEPCGLELMLAELESTQLEVALVPCRREVNIGGCIRVAVSRNCDWYRRFCSGHLSSRLRMKAAVDTRIKRRDTVRLLQRLITGAPSKSKYAPELQRLAERMARRMAS